MFTLSTLVRAIRWDGSYGEPGMPVPRDRLPASYYAGRRMRDRAAERSDTPQGVDGDGI